MRMHVHVHMHMHMHLHMCLCMCMYTCTQAAAPQLERFPRLAEGTAAEGADGRRRLLRLGGADALPCWELEEGAPEEAGKADGATTYLVESQPHLNLHLVTAPMLRACQLWLWRPDRWEVARSVHTVRGPISTRRPAH